MTDKSRDIALRLEKVGRVFDGHHALADIDLAVERGEIIALVGHSGCGKSTLLRIIAGVETASHGRVTIDGREVDGKSFVEPEARGVGFVFQDYALFPHLSVRDNVLFGLKSRPRGEAMAAMADVVRRVGIEHLVERFPHTLSGGEQQRVALARALAPRPAIILMDEPFSNLDSSLREKVRDETLSLLRSFGATAIMVTHDPEEALSTGDRVVLLREGRIAQAGSPYDLHDRPVDPYVAEFFCTFNKIAGIVDDDGTVVTPIGNFARRENLGAGTDVTVFIRPQSVMLSPDRGGLKGEIEQRIFRGATEQVTVRIEGFADPLKAIVTERLPDGITTVGVEFKPDTTLVF